VQFESESNDRQRSRLLEKMYTTIQVLSWENHRYASEVMEKLGLTLPQGIVLLTLDSFGGRAKMSDLIKVIQISGGTLTGIVDRLIRAGIVRRERDETDRRVVYVQLSEAGERNVQAIQYAHKVQLDLATSVFSNRELEQFNSLLTRFIQTAGVSPEVVQNYRNYARQSDRLTPLKDDNSPDR
jgi:MarR family transcriptional regulator, organic hydroperoxide resistance regulator